jgi:hypothetical protein
MDINEAQGLGLVPLKGDNFELEKFKQFLSQFSTHFELLKIDATYYFTTKQFLQLDDDAVLKKTRELVPKLKGVAKLTLDYKCPSTEVSNHVLRMIGDTLSQHIYEDIYLDVSDTTEVTKIDASTNRIISIVKEPQLEEYLDHLDTLIKDSYTSETLSYFAGERSWHNLYKTYEMIRYDLDETVKGENFDPKTCKITKYGWAHPDKLKAFKRAANDYHAEGSPRHSLASYLEEQVKQYKGKPDSFKNFKRKLREERKNKNPSQSQLMGLSEANALIGEVLRRWGIHKITQQRVCYAELVARSIMALISSSSNHFSAK